MLYKSSIISIATDLPLGIKFLFHFHYENTTYSNLVSINDLSTAYNPSE